MRYVTIPLYSFNELSDKAKQRALDEHCEFLNSTPQLVENEPGELVSEYSEHSMQDVLESIEMNEYFFFEDGKLAHCTTYTGNHPKAGITEFHFKGRTFDITV